MTSLIQREAERDKDVVASALRVAAHRRAPALAKTPSSKTSQLGDSTNTWKTGNQLLSKITSSTKPVPCAGTRIDVYWKDDDEWYPGQVVEVVTCDGGESKQRVRYDDGEEELLQLNEERWRKEQIRMQITEAQLKKFTKDLDNKLSRSLRKDKDDTRGYSVTLRDDEEEAERRGKPSYLHLKPHDANEWAGFKRVEPHGRTPEVLLQLLHSYSDTCAHLATPR